MNQPSNIALHLQPQPQPQPQHAHRLSLERIEQSGRTIPKEFRDTPQYDCEPLSEALGCALTLKIETANPIRSFKGRGASFLSSELQRRGDTRKLVCATAGNWGQAMAYACRARGLPLTVYAALDANPLKLARMRALGAEVRKEGRDFDAAKSAALAFAQATGGWLVEDGLEPEISEGHGSIAIELLANGRGYDAVVVPLGNGALLNGMARWIKAKAPATQVIGVCARGAPAMHDSWRAGRVIETAEAATLADGIAVRVPIPQAVQDMRGIVDDVLLIDDADIVSAMRLACMHAGQLLEPAGAVGLAALHAHPALFAGRRVATVLCGGNLTEQQMKSYLRFDEV